jgi:hypothetical protein
MKTYAEMYSIAEKLRALASADLRFFQEQSRAIILEAADELERHDGPNSPTLGILSGIDKKN